MTNNKKCLVVIPMAGRGFRFSSNGYTVPKPFIDVGGVPMIKRVVDEIEVPNATIVFICNEHHLTDERINLLKSLHDDAVIKTVPGYTDGTARTVLMGTEDLDQTQAMCIVNSDQIIRWNHIELTSGDPDGAIVCFTGYGENWSYVRVDESSNVIEVAEKKKISDIATGGVYYWKSLKAFRECAEKMIAENNRVNGEFYVAPVYQYAINTGSKISISYALELHQLGTPQELQTFLTLKNL